MPVARIPTSHDEILPAMTARLVAQLAPERIILFGSRSRGDAGPGSDYDLLVVMPFRGSRLDAALAVRRALREFKVPKDVLVLRPDEFEAQKSVPGTIAWPAQHGGVVLHAA